MYDELAGGNLGPSDRGIPDLLGKLPVDNPIKQWKIWSEEELQAAYELTLVGSPSERRIAIMEWSTRAGRSKGLPASRTGPRTALDALDYLKSLFNGGNSDLLKDAALRGIAQFFRGTCEEEATQFLASVVLSPEIPTEIRLSAYGYLWQVSEIRLNGSPKVQDSKRSVTLYPGSEKYHTTDLTQFADNLSSFAAQINHFTFQIHDPGFSIEHDVHWDWVRSFAAG